MPSRVKEPVELEAQYRLKGPLTKLHARNEPAYSIAEASRHLRLSPATLRSWVLGRPYPTARRLSLFEPVLKLAKKDPATLSFSNLIEAHVLRSLRTEHGVPLGAVRKALACAQRELKIDQLLLREELCTAGGELFLDRYGELMNLSASGQLAMRKVFEVHLKRVEWDKLRFPVRLYPFLVSESADAKSIVIDPQISFGRPVVSKAFISTRSIVDRIEAGEKGEHVARDYDLTPDGVEAAVVYERAA
jgi:uncharacterized protein (DUF433 family)/DNA-binding transcriptional MerR regulator